MTTHPSAWWPTLWPIRLLTLLLALLLCPVLLGQTPVAPPRDVEILRNLPFATAESAPLTLDLYRPLEATTPLPIVLVVHGGSWMSNDKQELRPQAEFLAQHGYAVVAMDYRLAPRFPYPAQRDDVRAALRWTQAHAGEYHLDLARLMLLGSSAGGQLAALLATAPEAGDPPIAGVVALYSPLDFTAPAPNLKSKIAVRLYLNADADVHPALYRQASPVTHVSAGDPPFLLIHGMRDEIVPYDQSVRMARALQQAQVPVTLELQPEAGHNFVTPQTALGRETLSKILTFLANCRRPDHPTPGMKNS